MAYVKAQHKKRSGYQKKLEKQGIRVILCGNERNYTYQVFEPTTGKIIISRDVIFDENKPHSSEGEKLDKIDHFLGTLDNDTGEDTDEYDDNIESLTASGSAYIPKSY